MAAKAGHGIHAVEALFGVGIAYAMWSDPSMRPVLVAAVVVAAATWAAARAWRRRRTRRATSTLDGLLALDPYAFEHAVASVLRGAGWTGVEVSGGAGDLQADVVGTHPSGEYGIAQAKRYAVGNKVGSPEIQGFVGMAIREHRATIGLFVTTSGFTGPARRLGEAHGVVLVDGDALVHASLTRTLPVTRLAD